MNIDKVKGIKEAVANMKQHYSFSVGPLVYRVFYNVIENEVDFDLEDWGENLEGYISLLQCTKPATGADIKRALKAREQKIDAERSQLVTLTVHAKGR